LVPAGRAVLVRGQHLARFSGLLIAKERQALCTVAKTECRLPDLSFSAPACANGVAGNRTKNGEENDAPPHPAKAAPDMATPGGGMEQSAPLRIGRPYREYPGEDR